MSWDTAVGFGVEIPFVKHLGFELTQFAGGHSEIAYTAKPEHLNSFAVTHGGALMTLVDHALSAVAWEACDRTPCVTLQLDSHFVSPVRPGQFVEARAEVIQRTGSLVFMRGELRTGESLVLTAHALLKVMKP